MATTLARGDAAVVGYNTDTTYDSISFVLLAPITSGTVIYFTDRAWNGSAFVAGGSDGTYTYTAGANLPAGTVVTIPFASLSGAGIDLEDAGDTLYMYQGTNANTPTTFLFAVDMADGNTTFNGNLTGTGLVAGTSAVAVDGDNANFFNNQLSLNAGSLFTQVSQSNSWTDNDNSPQSAPNGPLLTSPDQQIWVAGAGGGNGLITIDRDGAATTGSNVLQILQNSSNLYHPTDIKIDTVHGKVFVVDSDGSGHNRILQFSLSDLLDNPNSAANPTILYTDANVGTGIVGLEIDIDRGIVYFGMDTRIAKVSYDTASQSGTILANLGANVFVQDLAIALDSSGNGVIYALNSRIQSVFGNDSVTRNYIYRVANISASDTDSTGNTVTQMTVSPNDAAITGENAAPLGANGFPKEYGPLKGMDYDAANGILYMTTYSSTQDDDGDGSTVYPGRIVAYNVATGTYTTLWTQDIISTPTGPQGLVYYIEIDVPNGVYYIVDTTGSSGSPGDEQVWRGSLSGGLPTLFANVNNINGLAGLGMYIDNAPTLTVGDVGANSYTETAGANSAAGTSQALINSSTAADIDTAPLAQDLASAQVRISSGFLSGATHQDILSINGSTNSNVTVGGTTFAFSYNSSTGVMTITYTSGTGVLADFQGVLQLVQYSNSGDNPTNYGTDTTRTIAWSVSDGLLSSDEVTSDITVTGVNDAPINVVGGTATGNEDAATIAITGMSISDADADPASATMTVTLSVTHGVLDIATNVVNGVTAGQVTGDGTNTITITGTQDAINATLANATGLLYTPDANWNGTDHVHIVTSDGGSTGTGGTTSDTDDKTITVNAVNDAPVVGGDGTEVLTAINEDTPSASQSNTVSAIFGGQFDDSIDQVTGGSSANTLAGIAVIANGSSGSTGQWQYWNGATWVNIGAASTSAAVELAASTPLRFNPATDFNGTAPSLTVRLVDNSSGAITNGTIVNTTTNGGTTVFSTGTVTLGTSVTAVNDAPVVVNGSTVTLTAINEDNTNPAGDTVSNLFASHFNDAKDTVSGGTSANSFVGVAITGNAATTEGTWEVFTGGTWISLQPVSASSAYFVAAADSLRFVPAANYNGAAPALTLSLVEDSGGTPTTGTFLNLSTTGGSTPYSAALTLGETINSINDVPDVNADTSATFKENLGPITVTPNYTVTDVDNANLTGATISVADFRTGDLLGFVNQNGISGSYNSATGVLTLTGTSSVANYQAAIRSITYDGAADANFGGTDNNRTVDIVVTDGTDPSTTTHTTISIQDGVTANDDDVSTAENAVLSGNVENNNGHGADTGVTTITEVNGVAGNVGTQITLAGGGLLTVNSDGTFSFDPNGAYNSLAGPSSGASNLTATETFTYTVNGGDTATVTITVNGVDSTGDVLQGTAGGDDMTGGIGNDTLNGLGGNDDLFGGTGNDILNGGDNDDSLGGEDGNDKLNGDNGTDTLTGGNGADLIHGGAGDDHIFGGADNDTMYGDGGNDDMHGGTGNDVYYVDDAGDSVDEQSGEGTDTVRSSINYTLGGNVENLELQGSGDLNGTGNSGNNRIDGTIGNNTLQGMDGNDTLNGFAGKDNLQGGAGADIISGGDDNDTVDGGADNDNIHGDAGNDIVNGGDGQDIVYGDDGNDKVSGGVGADNIYGGIGADQLSGGDDNDHLYGGGDNDNLDGGAGADYMEGGTGNDVYIVDNTGDAAVENSGEGFDIVRSSVNFTLGANIESLELQGSANINGTGNELVNNITGNTGANTLKGMAGNDTLNGGDGNDTLIGGVGNDQMTGGNGFDTFVVLQESIGTPTLETDFVYDLNMAGGDRIDLSAIDANSGLAGNQAFQFVASFSHHAGEATLTYDAGAGVTYLRLDVNGDGVLDYQMKITGDVTGTSSNINTGGEPAGDGGWIL